MEQRGPDSTYPPPELAGIEVMPLALVLAIDVIPLGGVAKEKEVRLDLLDDRLAHN